MPKPNGRWMNSMVWCCSFRLRRNRSTYTRTVCSFTLRWQATSTLSKSSRDGNFWNSNDAAIWVLRPRGCPAVIAEALARRRLSGGRRVLNADRRGTSLTEFDCEARQCAEKRSSGQSRLFSVRERQSLERARYRSHGIRLPL